MREDKTRILEIRLMGFYFTLWEFDCQVRGKDDGAKSQAWSEDLSRRGFPSSFELIEDVCFICKEGYWNMKKVKMGSF